MRLPVWLRDSPLANWNYTLFLVGAFGLGSSDAVCSAGLDDPATGKFRLLARGARLRAAAGAGAGAAGWHDCRPTNRRMFLIWTQSALTVLAVILAALEYAGRASVAAILIVATLNGIANALNGRTWQAFIKELVGPEQLRRAIAVNSARFNLTRIVGPAIGGWLLVVAGAGACFAANAISFVAVIAALLAIRSNYQHPPRVTGKMPGGDYWSVARNPRILGVLIPAIGLSVLALPYANFFPAMARDVFHKDASGLSYLLTATGVGAVIGAAISGSSLVARHPARALAVLEIIAGIALAAFAWYAAFPWRSSVSSSSVRR